MSTPSPSTPADLEQVLDIVKAADESGLPKPTDISVGETLIMLTVAGPAEVQAWAERLEEPVRVVDGVTETSFVSDGYELLVIAGS